MNDLTAFVVNLKGTSIGVEVVYGYASTAFTLMTGSENALIELGISNEEINIREKLVIMKGNEDTAMLERIQKMYDEYSCVSKDELLEIAKKKRKEFIEKFAVRLKPLGFKKKGDTWQRSIEDEYYLKFEVQKLDFSDEYYFNVIIDKIDNDFSVGCFYTRICPKELCPLDWQLFPEDELVLFIDNEVIKLLSHIIHTPLEQLGKDAMIGEGCLCERDVCERCWVE